MMGPKFLAFFFWARKSIRNDFQVPNSTISESDVEIPVCDSTVSSVRRNKPARELALTIWRMVCHIVIRPTAPMTLSPCIFCRKNNNRTLLIFRMVRATSKPSISGSMRSKNQNIGFSWKQPSASFPSRQSRLHSLLGHIEFYNIRNRLFIIYNKNFLHTCTYFYFFASSGNLCPHYSKFLLKMGVILDL